MDKETSIELIKLYQNHRLLWDTFDTNFYNKELREEAWKDISNKLDIAVKDLKNKITNLRGILRKERHKTRQPTTDGEPYKSKWFLFNNLSFLPDLRGIQYNDNKKQPSTSAIADNEESDEQEVETDLSHIENEREESDNSDTDRPPETLTWVPVGNDSRSKVKKRMAKTKIIYQNKKSKSNEALYQTDDVYDAFGRLVTSELRKYDNRTLAYVKKAIMDIIFQADTGTFPSVKIEFNCED